MCSVKTFLSGGKGRTKQNEAENVRHKTDTTTKAGDMLLFFLIPNAFSGENKKSQQEL